MLPTAISQNLLGAPYTTDNVNLYVNYCALKQSSMDHHTFHNMFTILRGLLHLITVTTLIKPN